MADTTTAALADIEAAIERLRSAAGAATAAPLAQQLRLYRHLLYRVQELMVRTDRHPELENEGVTGEMSARRAINAAVDRLVEASLRLDDAAAIVERR
jgi:hypothetical protein